MSKKLSVVISSRNEVAMLAVTVRSALEELKPLRDDSEIVICDNSLREYSEAVKAVIPSGYVTGGRIKLLFQEFPCIFTAREKAIEVSEGEYVACLDAHMLTGRNMFRDLVRFADSLTGEDKRKMGFLHAPISWAHQHESSARHDRDMSKCELGDWGAAYAYPTKMTWKGMPWLCKREWFLDDLGGYGTLSKYKLAWGGGDMHIGIKPWLLGFENWAVPTSPGIHLGPFPGDATGLHKYRTYTESAFGPPCVGFLVSSYVLGGEECLQRNLPVVEKRFGVDFRELLGKIREISQEERAWLRSRQVMTFQEMLETKPWNKHSHNQLDGCVNGAVAGGRCAGL